LFGEPVATGAPLAAPSNNPALIIDGGASARWFVRWAWSPIDDALSAELAESLPHVTELSI
jgi:hypothetical protein